MGADGEGGAGVDDRRGAFEVGAGAPRRKAGSGAPAYVTAAASTCIIIIICIHHQEAHGCRPRSASHNVPYAVRQKNQRNCACKLSAAT
jgi:hypothetical protein